MRIGLSSLIGDGFGSGSFTFGEVAGGFLPYGTFIQTLNNQTYPISEGGSYFDSPVDGTTDIPNQKATVNELANGTGGVFLDWDNASNIEFIYNGVVFYVFDEWLDYESGNTVNVNGVDYFSQRHKNDYRHNGSGGYDAGYSNLSFKPYGTFIVSIDSQSEVPSGSGNYAPNGLVNNYYHDGNGGSYSVTTGAYYSSGLDTNITGFDVAIQLEVPSGSGSYFNTGQSSGYYWDGSGGVYSATKGTPYADGTFIYNDGMNNYYWNGYGGWRN